MEDLQRQIQTIENLQAEGLVQEGDYVRLVSLVNSLNYDNLQLFPEYTFRRFLLSADSILANGGIDRIEYKTESKLEYEISESSISGNNIELLVRVLNNSDEIYKVQDIILLSIGPMGELTLGFGYKTNFTVLPNRNSGFKVTLKANQVYDGLSESRIQYNIESHRILDYVHLIPFGVELQDSSMGEFSPKDVHLTLPDCTFRLLTTGGQERNVSEFKYKGMVIEVDGLNCR